MIAILSILIYAVLVFAQDRLFIVQGLDESLASVNLEDGSIDAQAVALGNIPNDIVAHNGLLYVTSSGLNTVHEIDPLSMTTLRDLQITSGINVWSAAFLNNDSLAVTCSVSNNIIVIRLSDEEIVGNLPAGVWPQGMVISGNRMFVTSTGVDFPNYGPGSVLVFDCTTFQRLDSLPVGMNPQNATIDNQNRLHVACTGNYDDVQGTIHVIDLTSSQTDTILELGGTPTNVVFSNEFAFVSAGGWIAGGEVYRYNLSTLEILNDSANPLATGFGAFDVEVNENGDFYVSCFDLDAVEHRTAEGNLIDSYPVSNGPGQMVILPTSSHSPYRHAHGPERFTILDAYPNPFNGSVNLTLANPLKTTLTISIFNILGERVYQLNMSPYQTRVTWTPVNSGLDVVSSGVYIARVDGFATENPKQLIYMR